MRWLSLASLCLVSAAQGGVIVIDDFVDPASTSSPAMDNIFVTTPHVGPLDATRQIRLASVAANPDARMTIGGGVLRVEFDAMNPSPDIRFDPQAAAQFDYEFAPQDFTSGNAFLLDFNYVVGRPDRVRVFIFDDFLGLSYYAELPVPPHGRTFTNTVAVPFDRFLRRDNVPHAINFGSIHTVWVDLLAQRSRDPNYQWMAGIDRLYVGTVPEPDGLCLLLLTPFLRRRTCEHSYWRKRNRFLTPFLSPFLSLEIQQRSTMIMTTSSTPAHGNRAIGDRPVRPLTEGEIQELAKFQELHNQGWELVEDGRFREGLPFLERAFAVRRWPASLNAIGIAKLGLEDYDGASESFNYVLQNSPREAESNYIYVGLCEWCRNRPQRAVEIWQNGIGSQYADAAGGMSIPLLLIFAGAVLNDSAVPELAEREIMGRMEKFGNNWPAPLAKYMLGMISRSDVEDYITSRTQALQKRYFPLFEFYRGVAALRTGDGTAYREALADFTSETHHRICPEWFLARHELRRE
jgi:tetratricopeptide (TPR) repeat protein